MVNLERRIFGFIDICIFLDYVKKLILIYNEINLEVICFEYFDVRMNL